jgi:hypothetical protein
LKPPSPSPPHHPQCGKFQPLEDFDGEKRSCRARLDKHNARRRRQREMALMLKKTGTVDEKVLAEKYGLTGEQLAPKLARMTKQGYVVKPSRSGSAAPSSAKAAKSASPSTSPGRTEAAPTATSGGGGSSVDAAAMYAAAAQQQQQQQEQHRLAASTGMQVRQALPLLPDLLATASSGAAPTAHGPLPGDAAMGALLLDDRFLEEVCCAVRCVRCSCCAAPGLSSSLGGTDGTMPRTPSAPWTPPDASVCCGGCPTLAAHPCPLLPALLPMCLPVFPQVFNPMLSAGLAQQGPGGMATPAAAAATAAPASSAAAAFLQLDAAAAMELDDLEGLERLTSQLMAAGALPGAVPPMGGPAAGWPAPAPAFSGERCCARCAAGLRPAALLLSLFAVPACQVRALLALCSP